MHSVLLISHDDSLRNEFRQHFGTAGHYVVVASSAREGLAAVERSRPDVTVIDLGLSDMPGMELVADVCRRGTMTIILTDEGGVELGVEAMRLGVESSLVKPVDMHHLAVVAERAAEKAALRSQNEELRERLRPGVKSWLIRAGLFIALVIVSAGIGLAIGLGGEEDPRSRVPIPVPVESEEQAQTGGTDAGTQDAAGTAGRSN